MAQLFLAVVVSAIAFALTGCGSGNVITTTTLPRDTTKPHTIPVTTTTTLGPSTAPPPTSTAAPAPAPITTTTKGPTTSYIPDRPACPLGNRTHGCFNTQIWDYATQFACGPNQMNRLAIYELGKFSCCGPGGTPYDSANKYCCYGEIHNVKSDEACRPWDNQFNTNCYCIEEEEPAPALLSESLNATVQDRQSCTQGDDKRGCFNGFYFDYSKEFPCGIHIVDNSKEACCETNSGFEPYNLIKDSCCLLDGKKQVVKDNAHACTCSKVGGACGALQAQALFF